MTKLIKTLAVVILTVFAVNAQAQTKVGHINLSELVGFMPEAKKANAEIDTMQAQLLKEIDRKSNEFKFKFDQYKQDVAKGTLLPSIQKMREEELNNLNQDLQNFQMRAQDDLDKKRVELYQPIIKKAQDAVNAVAKDKGYTYVLDSSAGTVLFSSEADDLMAAVKTKLNIK